MDYYHSSSSGSSRGRSSYRGGSSYRGSRGGGSDSYRGSRGSSRGYSGASGSGGYSSRGRGASSYYPKYDTSPKYSTSSESSKYGSSTSYGRYDDCYRRSDASFGTRDHRSDILDIASRKRERSDSYSTSQGAVSRRAHDEEEYRSSRYSGGSGYSEPRPYEERTFKKPRTVEYKPVTEYRPREAAPVRGRGISRGRIGLRGSFSRGRARGDSFGARRRGTFATRMATTATTSEILAIRRAKLLQNRLKEQSSASSDAKEKAEKPVEVTGDTSAVKASAVEKDDETKDVGGKEEHERITFYGRPFMKLQCPACEVKCITFKEYVAHLHQTVHTRAMKTKSDDLKTTLAAMRIAQRDKQKTADEEDLTSMTTRTFFCAICKLNYSQERLTHQSSDLHKQLKEFLMPYCKICRTQFQSPMLYESHICSLEHLRRKHDVEEREKKSATGLLDKFMVLDSVGSGDEVDEKEEEKVKEDDKEAEKEGEELLLGVEFIHEVKAKYCEVCRMYLPRVRDHERAIKRHCCTKEHLRCYLHFGNEALLEKISADDDGTDDKKGGGKTGEKEGDSEEPLDGDKLWDGLGELLDEAQPRVKSDDEDEEEGGRFDRFKSKEKKENGDISVEEPSVAEEVDAPSIQNPALDSSKTAEKA